MTDTEMKTMKITMNNNTMMMTMHNNIETKKNNKDMTTDTDSHKSQNMTNNMKHTKRIMTNQKMKVAMPTPPP